MAAGASLLERALALGVGDPGERLRAQIDLAYAVGETGLVPESDAMLAASMDAAAGLEQPALATARPGPALVRLPGDPSIDPAEVLAVAAAAVETFEQLGDQSGLALAERLVAMALPFQGRSSEAPPRSSGRSSTRTPPATRPPAGESSRRSASTWPEGRTARRRDEGIRRCEELLESSRDDPVLEAVVARSLALLLAMAGRFDEARDHIRRSSLVLEERDELRQRLPAEHGAGDGAHR